MMHLCGELYLSCSYVHVGIKRTFTTCMYSKVPPSNLKEHNVDAGWDYFLTINNDSRSRVA